MRILGVDAGSRNLGMACIQSTDGTLRAVDGSLLKVKGSGIGARLSCIQQCVGEYLDRWSPDEAALEDVFAHANVKTAVVLARVSAVIFLLCHERSLPLTLYPPATVKSMVTRRGNASKEQVRFVIQTLLELDGDMPDDVSDAYGVAVCHALKRTELYG